MNEYRVRTVSGIVLQWFGDDVESVRQEAEEAGHKVKRVEFRRRLVD